MATEQGNLSLLPDENGYVFISVTNPQYAPRFTRTLLDELKAGFYKENPDGGAENPSQNISTRFMAELSMKYGTPSKFDKVSEAQSKMDEIAVKIQDELKKVAGSQNDLGELEVKSHEMKIEAQGFEQKSSELESMMKWRNCKLCLIIGCVVLSILCYIFIPIIINATK